MKTFKEVYVEIVDEVKSERPWSSGDIMFSVEISRRLDSLYEPVWVDGKRLYQFKAGK
jgi:hypothetical protein